MHVTNHALFVIADWELLAIFLALVIPWRPHR
jgi:hypothetical protein